MMTMLTSRMVCFFRHTSIPGLHQAKGLAQNLIETVSTPLFVFFFYFFQIKVNIILTVFSLQYLCQQSFFIVF